MQDVGTNIIKEGSTYVQSTATKDYAYSTLDAQTQEVYNQIVYAIEKRRTQVRLATKSIAVMEQACQAVRYDHCEYFWLESFSYVTHKKDDEIRAIYFSPEFSMTKKEQEQVQAEIDSSVSDLLSEAPAEGSDFDKALYVYRSLIENVDYNPEAEDSQNIISTFINGETVCQGYAYGMQYLLEQLGLSCTTVEGSAGGEAHAWNLVCMDGAYYYVDTTWGNSQYVSAAEDADGSIEKYIDFNFFGMTTEEIEQTHTLSEGISLPECTATENNYFIHEGVYFDRWDAETIGDCLRQIYENGDCEAQLKFSDADLFEQMVQTFLDEGQIRDYCTDMNRVAYLELDRECTLLLLFE